MGDSLIPSARFTGGSRRNLYIASGLEELIIVIFKSAFSFSNADYYRFSSGVAYENN